jgi:hypothetical protein
MTSRLTATIAAMAALALAAFAGPAIATTRDDGGGGGQKSCTRSEQRTETTRFETRSCVDARADRVRADLRIEVRAQLPTAAAAADATARVRERVRSEERNGDMRVRVRTEHRRHVEDHVLRDELRVRVEVRNANHPQVTIGTAANGVLPITVTQLDAAGQPVVLRTLTVSVPQAQ